MLHPSLTLAFSNSITRSQDPLFLASRIFGRTPGPATSLQGPPKSYCPSATHPECGHSKPATQIRMNIENLLTPPVSPRIWLGLTETVLPATWPYRPNRRNGGRPRRIFWLVCTYCLGMLYAKFICSTMRSPLNSAGSGGNGTEALMPATAARSRASAPEASAMTSLGTPPSRLIEN